MPIETQMRRNDLVHPEMSYRVVGVLFDVWNQLGPDLREYFYQRAVARSLKARGFRFSEQVPSPVVYDGKTVGKQYLDFVIENAIILELKRGDRFGRANYAQVLSYLKTTGLRLAILANFTRHGVLYRRVLNDCIS